LRVFLLECLKDVRVCYASVIDWMCSSGWL